MNFFVTSAFVGGFIMVFGLLSAKLRAKLCISEAPLAVVLGIILGPACLGFLSFESPETREIWTLNISRIVIDIQVMAVAVGLPSRFVLTEWKSLLSMLLPGMCLMWAVSAGLVQAFLTALMIASCFTPTDPVLSSAIVQGHYAERNVRSTLRHLIAAESAANDGLGYPFLFIAVYCMKLGGAEGAKEWVLHAVLRGVFLSIAIGIVLGMVGRFLLKQCHKRKMIDAESLHIASFGMALFLLGVVSLIFSDDLLACFAAGCALSWDEWYKTNTNRVYFSEPWHEFAAVSIWRLVVLAILVLLLRRLPSTLLLYKITPAILDWKEALFAGWFGPIGVGAVFYYGVAIENFEPHGPFAYAREILYPVVYFIVLASVIVHGLSIPAYIGYRFLRKVWSGSGSDEESLADTVSVMTDAQITLNGVTLVRPPLPIVMSIGKEGLDVDTKKGPSPSVQAATAEKATDEKAAEAPKHQSITIEENPPTGSRNKQDSGLPI
ncbi:Sodium/hydrogen exchanger family-domain-containing protein [Dichotomocladium elegans]|nr:Sodium/hydrogen exchanger family-domain-containing protein [Dichotomocladium elegans]